jgi:hypothetical protein
MEYTLIISLPRPIVKKNFHREIDKYVGYKKRGNGKAVRGNLDDSLAEVRLCSPYLFSACANTPKQPEMSQGFGFGGLF